MSYGLFGTVGLPLRGWISVTEFIHAHHCEVEWHAGLEEGWVDGQWIDQSGVMVSARVHANGTVEAVPGALREARTLAARFGVVDGDNVMYADVVDADGERIGVDYFIDPTPAQRREADEEAQRLAAFLAS